jgi:TIR domain
LAEAEAKRDLRLVAEWRSNLGNVAEAQHRVGDAFRHWSNALFLLNRLGLARTAEAERLRRLIRQYHDTTPQVWVSYAHRDKERVDRVLRVLRHREIKVIYDREFLAGHSIHRQILAGIQRCPKHIVFWSAASQKSEWVQYEKEVLELLKEQRRKDLSEDALDNIVIFYCFSKTLPKNADSLAKDDFRDDLQICEGALGFKRATQLLIRSITTSEVLAVLEVTPPAVTGRHRDDPRLVKTGRMSRRVGPACYLRKPFPRNQRQAGPSL